MGGFSQFLERSDGVGRTVALLLLLMSISAWVVILWKGLLLQRARQDIARAIPAFWEAPTLAVGRARLQGLDRESTVLPLVEAAARVPAPDALEAQGGRHAQLTRQLRDALQVCLGRLQAGQVLLASIGSTSPFIGLFGTVWGIYHALLEIGDAGQYSIDRVAGPVGEALIMTAAGLAVAIPAVLAYNLFGKWLGAAEAQLEGFAHDLRDLALEMGSAAATDLPPG